MRRPALLLRVAVTLAVVAIAAVIGWRLWVYYEEEPWTRDAQVAADIVGVTPDVSGLVSAVRVQDNQVVHRGDVLFVVDQARFELALRQAQAVVASRLAALEQANRDLARYTSLTTTEISRQQVEQAQATQQGDAALYQQAMADRDVAALNLERTQVTAPVNGIISNFSLRPGDYVTAGKAVTALVDTDTLRIDAYFEETRLPRIEIGDRVRLRLMGEPHMLAGHVESIAGGVKNQQVSSGSDLLASVNPTFSWVRLAQRIPVRVVLDAVPAGVRVIPGRTATVFVEHGGA
ncbi:MAG TPA: efflux RND transporter periplasmic adaptor subunit [Rhodopila sp.]|nr:efflux RND transporter periplasmic adaptor subunit [Rhodopila sp.]